MEIRAVVLTYDRNFLFVDHMIDSYHKVWPNHPFRFRVPYQDKNNITRIPHDNIDFIKTSKSIKSTVLTLLDDLDDEEWIYWCIDDKYPVELDIKSLNGVINLLPELSSDISGILFSFENKMHKRKNTIKNAILLDQSIDHLFYRRKNYSMIWMHQLVKVKVIRHLFEQFPDVIANAKDMDGYKNKLTLPDDHTLYVLDKSIALFGESTHRGKITKNCYESLKKNNYAIPADFETVNKEIYLGTGETIKASFFGKLLNL